MRQRRLIGARFSMFVRAAFLVCYVFLTVPIVATDDGVCRNDGCSCLDSDGCLFIPESASDRKGPLSEMAGKLFACDFEVFGIVQGGFECNYDVTLLHKLAKLIPSLLQGFSSERYSFK